MKRLFFLLVLVSLFATVLQAQVTTVTTANGTWTLYPALPNTYQTQVNAPINSDGSSNFAAKRGVIPVKFSLFTALGSPVFQSIGSDSDTSNDYSYLTFTPNATFTVSQLSALTAAYNFTHGDCHGGSLRWSVETATGNIFIYYGLPPQFGNGGTGGCTASSVGGEYENTFNMVNRAETRYDLTQVGGPFYGAWADVLSLAGNLNVLSVSLVLDSGWGGDQELTLGTANVTTVTGINDNFAPPTSTPVKTCQLPAAEIQVTKTSGTESGNVNEVLSVQPADNNGLFRVVDCSYMYNLDVSSLRGTGSYSVQAIINGSPVTIPATFDLK